MAAARDQAGPRVVVSPDKTCAKLLIPPETCVETLSDELLIALAREREVEITQPVLDTLHALAARFALDHAAIDEPFAHGLPATPGADARVQWAQGCDPAHIDDDPKSTEHVDHYARRTYIAIRKDQEIARLHPAQPGTDGRDVTGRTIPAPRGKNLSIAVDENSILRLADGRLLSLCEGVLRFDGTRIRVQPRLEIAHAVDFSTGHIDFPGDVTIREGIRDRFKVTAEGDATIDGLIDASFVRCGGDLHAVRGVAGQGVGTLDVGGNAHVGYLDRVSGSVARSLHVQRELLHCSLTIGASILAPAGAIVGGDLTVLGHVRVAELGSPAETPTHIRLESARPISPDVARRHAELTAQATVLRREQQTLAGLGAKRIPSVVERLTELSFELAELGEALAAIAHEHPEINSHARADAGHIVEASRAIHAKVTLHTAGRSFTIARAIRGPVRIAFPALGDPTYTVGHGPSAPLTDLTNARAA